MSRLFTPIFTSFLLMSVPLSFHLLFCSQNLLVSQILFTLNCFLFVNLSVWPLVLVVCYCSLAGERNSRVRIQSTNSFGITPIVVVALWTSARAGKRGRNNDDGVQWSCCGISDASNPSSAEPSRTDWTGLPAGRVVTQLWASDLISWLSLPDAIQFICVANQLSRHQLTLRLRGGFQRIVYAIIESPDSCVTRYWKSLVASCSGVFRNPMRGTQGYI